MTAITVTNVNIATLSDLEADDLRAAEAEAMEFYGTIEQEETERLRLSELHRLSRLMWTNRFVAIKVTFAELNTNALFTESEKATLIQVAENLHPEGDVRQGIKALNFINAVSRLHQTMQTGYYFDNLPATELLALYGA